MVQHQKKTHVTVKTFALCCLGGAYAPAKTVVYLEEPIGYPAQPGLIRPSDLCTCLQIRCSAENGTDPTDSDNYSLKSLNRDSEFLLEKVHKVE